MDEEQRSRVAGHENIKKQVWRSINSMEETKAPVLWTIQCDGVDEGGWQHRGMIRNTKATKRNKWQQKRMKNNEVMTLNVNQRY
jgi:hypothetical protein